MTDQPDDHTIVDHGVGEPDHIRQQHGTGEVPSRKKRAGRDPGAALRPAGHGGRPQQVLAQGAGGWFFSEAHSGAVEPETSVAAADV